MPEKEQNFVSPDKDEKEKTDEGVERKGMVDKEEKKERTGKEIEEEIEKQEKVGDWWRNPK